MLTLCVSSLFFNHYITSVVFPTCSKPRNSGSEVIELWGLCPGACLGKLSGRVPVGSRGLSFDRVVPHCQRAKQREAPDILGMLAFYEAS